MSKKKKIKKQPRQLSEIVIREKANLFIKAIKEYWSEQEKLEDEYRKAALSFGGIEDPEDVFLKNVYKLILLFLDGVIFIRYKTEGDHKPFVSHVVNIKLNEWLKDGLKIPYKDGFACFPMIHHAPGATIELHNSSINDFFVEYLHLSAFRYDQPEFKPNIAKAIVDFRITILGIIFQSGSAFFSPKIDKMIRSENVIEQLRQKVYSLKTLLQEQVDEENIQNFLKENPFLLKPSSEAIPKKKLGEDFITDFVLINILDQGPCYTLVELEKSSHPILTKGGALTSQVSHAIGQTRAWDIWLEENKAYLQNKLPGFESPEYLVVIGRTKDMSDTDKAYLRSHNREYRRLKIMSYDDIIAQVEEFIDSVKKIEKN